MNLHSLPIVIRGLFRVVSAGLILFSGASLASAQDFQLYAVGKSVSYVQDSTAAPVQSPAEDDPWEAFIGVFGFDISDYTAISLTLPDSTVLAGEWSAADGEWRFADDFSFPTKAALDVAVPDSTTPYTFTFTPATGSPISVPLDLNGGNYPNAPHIQNFATTQAVDHTQDFELSWAPFAGGTVDDTIIVEIEGAEGGMIFESGFPGMEEALDGTVTSVTIPADTLAEGRTYEAVVTFFRTSDSETSLLPGANGLALYAVDTDFLLRAAGTAVGPASTRLRFSFSHDTGTIVGTAGQNTYPLTTRFSLNFDAIDDPAPPTSVFFTGPAGSQMESPVESFGSANIGPNSSSFYSSEFIVGSPPTAYPPGGDYEVGYGALTFPFAIADPEAEAKMRVVVPVLTLNGANEISAINWSYFGTDGTASTIHPDTIRINLSVRTDTSSDYFELSPTETSFDLPNPMPLELLRGINFNLDDNAGNFFRSSHEVEVSEVPIIVKEPRSFTVAPGASVTFSVEVQAMGTPSFQWKKNGEDIPGADQPSLTITDVSAEDAGSYTVVISNNMTIESSAGVLSVSEAASSFLVNLSNRGIVGTGDEVMIPGFVIEGTGTKRLLIRVVGPGLANFGVTGTLEDPQLDLAPVQEMPSSNDNWGMNTNAAEIVQVSEQIGAFALTGGSADAAILIDLPPGAYTVKASGAAGGTGTALVELYDVDPGANPDARLINISNRGIVGTGDDLMIPGFVVSGESARTFLIRAVGPTLGGFGVEGVLSDTLLQLFQRQGEGVPDVQLAENDDWWNQDNWAYVAAVAVQVGAFPLEENSRDAALLITLNPGEYTVQASGAAATSGVALVEIYEVP